MRYTNFSICCPTDSKLEGQRPQEGKGVLPYEKMSGSQLSRQDRQEYRDHRGFGYGDSRRCHGGAAFFVPLRRRKAIKRATLT